MNEIILTNDTNKIVGLDTNNRIEFIDNYHINANTKLYYNFNNSNVVNFNGVVGTTSGITYGDGIYSKYAQFPLNKTNSGNPPGWIQTNYSVDVTGTSTTTLMWIYVDLQSSGNTRQFIIGGGTWGNAICFEGSFSSLAWFTFGTWSSQGGWYLSSIGNQLPTGWMFLSVSRDIIGDVCNFYYTNNGIYTERKNIIFTPYIGSTKGTSSFDTIGSVSNAYNCLNGRMDEIIVENRLWTDDEIKSYYYQSRPKVIGQY